MKKRLVGYDAIGSYDRGSGVHAVGCPAFG